MDMLINVDPAMAEDEAAFSYEYENGRRVVYHFVGRDRTERCASLAVLYFIADLTGEFSDAETLGRELADRVEVVS
jgi:hypothetical protein